LPERLAQGVGVLNRNLGHDRLLAALRLASQALAMTGNKRCEGWLRS
jgi:hypothetical protein